MAAELISGGHTLNAQVSLKPGLPTSEATPSLRSPHSV